MENEIVNQTENLRELLQTQIDMMLAVISRPVVQYQLVAMFIILLISWLGPESIRRWWWPRYANNDTPNVSSRYRRLAALYHLYPPILALILLYFTRWLFGQLNLPNGLLVNLTIIIWFWLFYRVLLSVIYMRFGDSARPYRNWIITPIFILLVVLQASAILPGSKPLINATISLGTITVSLGGFLTALIVLYIFVVVAWVVKQMMVEILPTRLNAELGVIESIATLVRYLLLSIGIVLSLGVMGLDFTSLAIVAGGLSVGIGIGLQDTVSNFVSGLVLLFEQSLRPGDVVELDGRISQVERISLRATTVRTRTNEELIIPNNRFTSEQVKNLTRSDRLVQVLVPFGVSYKSNPQFIRHLAVETALTHPQVLSEPTPRLLFSGYGESSLDFNLSASINQPELMLSIRSDLYYLLWDAFAEHNIEIPFPQRDLNLRDGWEKFASDLRVPGSATDGEA
ncbi:MAG: mechanosensitive ion channel [Anaerolineae bacterium]|nr:mechanosensitive ion channel [Anaerolineae bacterium]